MIGASPIQPVMTEQEYIKTKEEILSEVPPEFHTPMGIISWEKGHSYGYDEVILLLRNLVYEFKPYIKKYAERIKREAV
jgi:hypothetical protein